MVCIVDSSSGLGLTWNISHHAGVRIVAVLWLALSLVGGGELEGVILAAYGNREGRAVLVLGTLLFLYACIPVFHWSLHFLSSPCISRLAAAYPVLACFRTSWGLAGYMG